MRRFSGLDWAVIWDAASGGHVYLRDVDLVIDGNRIAYIGPHHDWVDSIEEVNGHGLMAMPGLINLHSHPCLEPIYRGIREDHGVPEHYMAGLFERNMAYWPDEEGMAPAAVVGFCELLLSGVTTVVDISFPYEGWIDLVARSGIRCYLAPAYASGNWHLTTPHTVDYRWKEDNGKQRFDEAMQLIDAASQHPSGRLLGLVSPAQIDTCTEALLRDSVAAARERKLPFTVHAAQSVLEFQEITRRHGITPIQFAARIGLLGERSIIGHGIFIDEHSWLHWHSREDIRLLADSGSAVAHCPTPFARYGLTLEGLGKYQRAGVTVGIGTDVAPHNMIEEMRLAAILARISAGDIRAATTGDVFNAATLGGAEALGRDDLGRLAVGAKADLVLIDVKHPGMMPVRDPLRSLIFSAADRAVRDVYVDGVQVVRDGKVLGLEIQPALELLQAAQQRMEAAVPHRDPRLRTSAQIAPLSLPHL